MIAALTHWLVHLIALVVLGLYWVHCWMKGE